MNRDIIYTAIDREREYQDSLESDRVDGHIHSAGEEVMLIEHYARRAIDAWCNNPGDSAAIGEVVKIAALCVRCMENHGIVER